jgi:hypothetical protein
MPASPAARSEPGPRNILAGIGVDPLANALLSLTAELWTLTDRVRILEEVLKRNDFDVHAAVDRFVPSVELERELDAKRDKLIDTVVRALRSQAG